jgi:glutathione S-transferase
MHKDQETHPAAGASPELVLYQFGNSVCAQKVRITLLEKGLRWETRNVDLFRGEQYDPAYLRINPKGLVPALVHQGQPVVESTLICEYLDEVYPEPALRPADPFERMRMRLWSKMVDEALHEGVTEISFSAMFRERMQQMSEAQRQQRFRNVGDPRRRDRFMSTYALGVDSPYVMWAVAAYEKAFEQAEQALAGSGPWLLGTRCSLADINLMPYAARLHYLGLLEIWLAARPLTRAWWQRVQTRDTFCQAVANPLAPADRDAMAAAGARIRPRIAALRAAYLAECSA